MAVTLMDAAGIDVVRYVGPVGDGTGSRKRFQITSRVDGTHVALSWSQLSALINWVAGTDAEGILRGPGIE